MVLSDKLASYWLPTVFQLEIEPFLSFLLEQRMCEIAFNAASFSKHDPFGHHTKLEQMGQMEQQFSQFNPSGQLNS